jgi:cysteine synthase A
MAKIYNSVEELVGGTPLISVSRYCETKGVSGRIIVKSEKFNPAGSSKDRVGKSLIDDAERRGVLKKGGCIIEPTSGNTGIGLAMCAAVRGYRVILTMPDTMSEERRKLLSSYGAELVLTPGELGMKGAIEKAERLLEEIPHSYMPGQFTNEANCEAHYRTTGPEIWSDTDGDVDVFVATVGTGGTLTGTARFLKEKKPDIYVAAVEPASSPLLSKGYAGSHGIQGIGANFVPEILDRTIYDEVITVEDGEAFAESRLLAKTEGLLVGISSGAALSAAVKLAERPEFAGKRIVVLLPDTGERYLSVM